MKLMLGDVVVPGDDDEGLAFNGKAAQAIADAEASLIALDRAYHDADFRTDWPEKSTAMQAARARVYRTFQAVAALVVDDREGVLSAVMARLKKKLDEAADVEQKIRGKAATALRKAGITPEGMPGASHNPHAAQVRFDAQLNSIPDVREAAGHVEYLRDIMQETGKAKGRQPDIVRQVMADFRAIVARVV